MRLSRATNLNVHLAAVVLSASAVALPVQAQRMPATAPIRLVPLEVNVNRTPSGNWTLLERDGVLYAPADAFVEWRLTRNPQADALDYLGQAWYPLTSVAGFKSQMNFANQSIDLVFSPEAFAASRLGPQAPDQIQVTPAEPALFLNFDVNLTQTSNRGAASTRDSGVLGELGFSNRLGVLTSSFVLRNLLPTASQPASLVRLETRFSHDFPDSGLSLRLGDTATRPGSWGRSVYFGGVQIGRNFGLKPGFITQPLPVFSGVSSAPSTVELYINDALRQTSQVPTGPFAVDNMPLLTGSGQARIVVRDVLGRETVLVQDFFSSSELLEEGLTDWSLSAGAERRDLGAESASYGRGFVSGLWRRGLSKAVTLEADAEVSRHLQGGGLGIAAALPGGMLGQAAVAVSRGDTGGSGRKWLVGTERSSLRHGFSLRAEGASRDYGQLGQQDGALPYRRQWSGSYTYTSERFGSLGLGFALVDSYDRGPLKTYSANYAVKVGERSSLSLNVVKVVDATGSASATSVGVNLLIPLEQQITVAANVSSRGRQAEGYISATQGLQSETGVAWRAIGGSRSREAYAEGGLSYQGTKGFVSADASVSPSQQSVRLGAQGGLVMIDGQLFATRRVDDSFALVEVPGYANVGVGFQSSILARTDKDGRALVPRLLAYQPNSLRLDPTELPISAELDSIEQIVVPAARSGVIVRFPVRSGRGALIRIVLDDGEPAPAGASIELVGDKQEFFVARRGEAFVTGLQATNTLRLKWHEDACTVAVDLPAGVPDDIARVGPLKCSGVRR